MNCFECHASGAVSPSIAVCRRCGAGLCAEHVTTGSDTLHRPAGTGLATNPRPARRLTCPTCHQAEVTWSSAGDGRS